MLQLRLALPSDTEQILSLYRSVIGTPFCVWSELYPTTLEIERDLKDKGLYVFTENECIIGALSILPPGELSEKEGWSKAQSPCELARVAVAKKRQGQGLAAEMVSCVLPRLKELGYDTVRLAVVPAHMPARKTYEKTGFVAVGETFIYGADYVMMEKSL